jgi:hypothetical protein
MGAVALAGCRGLEAVLPDLRDGHGFEGGFLNEQRLGS